VPAQGKINLIVRSTPQGQQVITQPLAEMPAELKALCER
jgi:hypothetical protein